jgi:hypothetical protein
MDEDNNNSYDDYPRESVADGSEVDYREAEENDDRRHERRDGEGTEGGAAPAVNKGNNLYVTNLAFEVGASFLFQINLSIFLRIV